MALRTAPILAVPKFSRTFISYNYNSFTINLVRKSDHYNYEIVCTKGVDNMAADDYLGWKEWLYLI